jgi:hypothetical protein
LEEIEDRTNSYGKDYLKNTDVTGNDHRVALSQDWHSLNHSFSNVFCFWTNVPVIWQNGSKTIQTKNGLNCTISSQTSQRAAWSISYLKWTSMYANKV